MVETGGEGWVHRLRKETSRSDSWDVHASEWISCWDRLGWLLLDLWLDDVRQFISLQALDIDAHVSALHVFVVAEVRLSLIAHQLLEFVEKSDSGVCQVDLRVLLSYISLVLVQHVLDSDSDIVCVIDWESFLLFVFQLVRLGVRSVFQETILDFV